MKSIVLRAAVVCLACSCSTIAMAQTAPQTPATAKDPGTADEPITVTGTRIKTGFDQPTPVTTSTIEQLEEAQPAGIATSLNQLPQFQGSVSPRNAPLSTATGPFAARGNYLNLRGVGINRTLILLDGERAPPTTSTGQVDVNSIPEMLVSRVDVVTAGVSAVYGSDAVTGVVNYILDDNFTGLRLKAQTGISDFRDAFSYRVGAAGGFDFSGDRGHLIASIEHEKTDEILHKDRPLSALNYIRGGKGATNDTNIGGQAAFPVIFVPNAVTTLLLPGGSFQSGPGAGLQVNSNGQLVPIVRGSYVASNVYVGGDGGALDQGRTLISGGTSTRAFGRASYEVANGIDLFAEGMYTENRNPYHTAISFFTLLAYPQNAFLPNALKPTAAFLAANPATANTPLGVFVRASPSDLTAPRQLETSRSWSVKTGVRGDLGDGWNFNAVYIHGDVKQHVEAYEVDSRKLFAAADSIVNPANNQIVCRITITNPTIFPGCVPYNPFGNGTNGANRAAVENFIYGLSIYETTNKTDDFVFNVSGEPLSTWAGPVGVSFGAEYRRNSLMLTSNSDPAVTLDSTGIRGLTTLGVNNAFNITNIGVANGRSNVKEANIELLVPLAAKDSAIGELIVSGAGRWTEYSTSGTVYTWKGGATWEPIPDVRFRGTLSRDIRAPTLYELFAGRTSVRIPLSDPHTNFANPTGTFVFGGGNADLTPEKADTFTAGIVLKPRFVPRLTLSVDYYDLKISDAITSLSAAQVLQVCENSNGTGPSCDNIDRPLPFSDRTPANFPTSIFAGFINAAALETKGIDIEATYSVPVGNGTLGFRALANHLIRYASQNSSTDPLVSQAGYFDYTLNTGTIQPKWRGTVSANYRSDSGFNFFLQGRYVGELKMGEIPGLSVTGRQTNVFDVKKTDAVMYFDANVSQTIKGGPSGSELELFFNVNNLFNKQPPVIPGNSLVGALYPTYMPLYDVMGRYFTFGAKIRL